MIQTTVDADGNSNQTDACSTTWRNTSHVIVACPQTFSTYNDFLFELFVNPFESCYLRTSAPNQSSLLMLNISWTAVYTEAATRKKRMLISL